ncbi:hypothetical protein GCM10027563_46930 [Parasphingorhabdus pacifica]
MQDTFDLRVVDVGSATAQQIRILDTVDLVAQERSAHFSDTIGGGPHSTVPTRILLGFSWNLRHLPDERSVRAPLVHEGISESTGSPETTSSRVISSTPVPDTSGPDLLG